MEESNESKLTDIIIKMAMQKPCLNDYKPVFESDEFRQKFAGLVLDQYNKLSKFEFLQGTAGKDSDAESDEKSAARKEKNLEKAIEIISSRLSHRIAVKAGEKLKEKAAELERYGFILNDDFSKSTLLILEKGYEDEITKIKETSQNRMRDTSIFYVQKLNDEDIEPLVDTIDRRISELNEPKVQANAGLLNDKNGSQNAQISAVKSIVVIDEAKGISTAKGSDCAGGIESIVQGGPGSSNDYIPTGFAARLTETLNKKGVKALICPPSKDPKKVYPSIPFVIDLNKIRLSGYDKQVLIEEIESHPPHYRDSDLLLQRIRSLKGPIDIESLISHVKKLDEFRQQKYFMMFYSLYEGNTVNILSRPIPGIEKYTEVDMGKIAEKNQLTFFFNKGTQKDICSNVLSDAFEEGYADFLLGKLSESKSKWPRRAKNDYIIDETFIKYVLKSMMRYVKNNPGADAQGFDPILPSETLEGLCAELENQMEIPASENPEKPDKRQELARALENINIYLESHSSMSKVDREKRKRILDGRKKYHQICFKELVGRIGPASRIYDTKNLVAQRIKSMVADFIFDGKSGPCDISNLVREEYRIMHPGRNPVFRVNIDMGWMTGLGAIVKVFDYRGKSAAERAEKLNEARREIKAADYFSRWLHLNNSFHFFTKHYEKFSVIMMRDGGKHTVYDVLSELSQTIEEEKAAGRGESQPVKNMHAKRSQIMYALMRKMAQVHAYNPDDLMDSDLKKGFDGPMTSRQENFKDCLEKEIFSLDESCLAAPFKKYGSLSADDANSLNSLLARLSKSSAALSEFLTISPSVQIKGACKDSAQRNWEITALSTKGNNVDVYSISPIDYGSIRSRPLQMDVGNAFVLSGVEYNNNDIESFAKAYFFRYNEKVERFNHDLENLVKTKNMKCSFSNQLVSQIMHKGFRPSNVRPMLGEFAAYVSSYVQSNSNGQKEFASLSEGRINPRLVKLIEDGAKQYIRIRKKDKANPLESEQASSLEMVAENVVNFFSSLKLKKPYFSRDYTKSLNQKSKKIFEESKKRTFSLFYEGLMACMAYKSLRNVASFINALDRSGMDPKEQARFFSEELKYGVAGSLEKFISLYDSKKTAGINEGGYEYTSDRQGLFEDLKQGILELAGKYQELYMKMEAKK